MLLKVICICHRPLFNFYDYDPNGNLTERGDPDRAGHYDYDPLDRLTTESSPAGQLEYTYDPNGNRVAQTGTNGTFDYRYAPDSNRLSARDQSPYLLDASGNTLHDGRLRYEYGPEGRLAAVYAGENLLARYRYDALGQRIAKTTAAGTTHYLYDLHGRLLLEGRDDGQPQRAYLWLDERPLAQIQWTLGQGNGKAKGITGGKANPPGAPNAWTQTITWLHTDHLQTPRLGSNSEGSFVWRWQSDAFGTPLPDEDFDGDGRTVTVNLRFPGQYFDAETGLHYNYFRDYDPSTGRYVQSDPIGLDGGLNTYTYVMNNPINFIDPRGLDVYVCGRPADLPFPMGMFNHEWILTDTVEAGMGPAGGGVPAQNGNSDWPGAPVAATDHTGQSTADNASCDHVEKVDEDCVNKLLTIGRQLGRWSPTNQCQSFVMDVLIQCTK